MANRANGYLETDEGLVVVVAGTSWDGIWQSERHVAMHLAERQPVLWVDPQIWHLSPMRNPTAWGSARRPRLREHPPAHPGDGPRCHTAVAARSRNPPGTRCTGIRAIGASVHSVLVAWLNDATWSVGAARLRDG